jgi:hypothetical protein
MDDENKKIDDIFDKAIEEPVEGEQTENPDGQNPIETDQKKKGDDAAPENTAENADGANAPDATQTTDDDDADQAPKGFAPEFRNGAWKNLAPEVKAEISRVYDNQDNYIQRLSAEKNARDEAIAPYKGYMKAVMESQGADANTIIRNCVGWISQLEMAPENTILNGLASKTIRLQNVPALIRGIAQIYGIDINQIAQSDANLGTAQDQAFLATQAMKSRAEQDKHAELAARAAEENEVDQLLTDFRDRHPDVKFNGAFQDQVQDAFEQNPSLSLIDALEVAYAATKPAPKQIDIAAKTAKTALKTSTPEASPNSGKSPKIQNRKDEDAFLDAAIKSAMNN